MHLDKWATIDAYLYLNLLIPQCLKKHACCLILDMRNNYPVFGISMSRVSLSWMCLNWMSLTVVSSSS